MASSSPRDDPSSPSPGISGLVWQSRGEVRGELDATPAHAVAKRGGHLRGPSVERMHCYGRLGAARLDAPHVGRQAQRGVVEEHDDRAVAPSALSVLGQLPTTHWSMAQRARSAARRWEGCTPQAQRKLRWRLLEYGEVLVGLARGGAGRCVGASA